MQYCCERKKENGSLNIRRRAVNMISKNMQNGNVGQSSHKLMSNM